MNSILIINYFVSVWNKKFGSIKGKIIQYLLNISIGLFRSSEYEYNAKCNIDYASKMKTLELLRQHLKTYLFTEMSVDVIFLRYT